MAAELEVALLMIKAIEAALNPLTTQQERKEAYEVVFLYHKFTFRRAKVIIWSRGKKFAFVSFLSLQSPNDINRKKKMHKQKKIVINK